ncbi:MAG: carbohydrate kinase family protein [Armatimonadetes bacterium]|nr:carbohydrate kinase family protein [Armatimonadota bacterium]
MPDFDVVSIGSATQDVFVSSDQTRLIRVQHTESEEVYLAYEYGAKVAVDDLFISTGGGAVNTAIAFAKLGLRSAAVSEIGQDDAGNMIERALQERGVDVSMLVRNPDHNTGYSVILTGPTGDRTVLVHRGAGSCLSHSDIDWDRVGEAGWVYLSSLSGESAALWHDVARWAVETKVKLAINPGSRQIGEGLEGLGDVLAAADIIFVNKGEAYRFTGTEEHRGDVDERAAAETLHRAGCRRVVMTMGAEGARAFDGEQHYYLPAPKVQVVSNLGAGDAFASACLAAIHYGLPLREALKAGAINAGSVVTSTGATTALLDWATIQSNLGHRG